MVAQEVHRDASPNDPEAGILLVERGLLVPAKSHIIRNESGRALHVLYAASLGETVAEGDLVVELDVLPLVDAKEEAALAAREAQLQADLAREQLESAEREFVEGLKVAEMGLEIAERRLKGFVEQEYPTERITLENEVRVAEEAAAFAKSAWQRISKQPQNALTKPKIDETHLAHTRAATELERAKNALKLFVEHSYPVMRAERELHVLQGRLDLTRARREQARAERRARMHLELAEARRGVASDRVGRLERQIRRCKWYAPTQGVVISRLGPGYTSTAKPGQLVQPGEAILGFGETEPLELHVRVSPEAGQRTRVGRKATVRFDALPGRTFAGRVAEVGTGTSEFPPRWLVIVRLEDRDAQLRPGMSAQVQFETQD
jgi:multidrug resistance efflux pump